MRGVFVWAAGALLAAAVAGAGWDIAPHRPTSPHIALIQERQERDERQERHDTLFNHPAHAELFPTCVTCHAGAAAPGERMWPEPESCATCHDGEIEEEVDWSPPIELPRTNLQFEHGSHADTLAAAGREPAKCVDCHSEMSAPWMAIEVAVAEQCLDCHEIEATHYAASETDCATCHVPLAQATRLTAADVAAFPTAPSHEEEGFEARGGHGLLAYKPLGAPAPGGVAVSCATCHARDFCVTCHVDAPEQEAIQALDQDVRSLEHSAELAAPESHGDMRFVSAHDAPVKRDPAECQACHTQESCLVCHVATPRVASEMHRAEPGRGEGATVEREVPPTHRDEFIRWHGPSAAARPESCAGCHGRQDCLECHRPNAAAPPAYHPASFLSRHPASAYARETSCSDCHSTRAFCADCHATSGLVAQGPLRRGYHDGTPFFIAGHGQAARQSLESCVACHAERDCLTCHSALGGRRFNPHGPGFDAARLRRKNPEMCTACHGTAIP